MKKTAAALTSLLLATACTTSLSTQTDATTSGQDMATIGVPYSLPLLQYEIKVTRALAQCKQVASDGSRTEEDLVRFSVKVEATPRYIAGETFLIDYRELSGPSKITSFALANHEDTGTLRSINVSAEDRTAQIIANITNTAVGVASLVNGIPLPGANDAPTSATPPDPLDGKMLACTDEAVELLDDVASRTRDLKKATEELKALNDRIKVLVELTTGLSEAQKDELNGPDGLIARQRRKAAEVGRAQTALTSAQTKLASIVTFSWPNEPSQKGRLVALDDAGQARVSSLLTLVDRMDTDYGRNNQCDHVEVFQCVESRMGVAIELEPLFSGRSRQTDASEETNPQTASAGLFVRPPNMGRLIACHLDENTYVPLDGGQNTWLEDQECEETDRTVLQTDATPVPQLGTLRFFPFENGTFQNNTLSVLLREDGSIEKFEYKETSASGETGTGALNNTVSQIGALATAIRNDREADETAATAAIQAARDEELAVLQFEIDRLTRQRQLEELNTPPQVSELSSIQAETAQAEARAQLLEALLREQEAEKALRESGNE